jgi:hypothetical protein
MIGAYPTTNNLIQTIARDNDDLKRTIAKHAQGKLSAGPPKLKKKGARILMHKDVRGIINSFLAIKSQVRSLARNKKHKISGFCDFIICILALIS